jgi:hypothetical protein
MKQMMMKWAGVLVALFCLSMTTTAQNAKSPLSGSWYIGQIGGNWGEGSITLAADEKVGINPYMAKRSCHGYVYMSDENFEKEKSYCLTYSKTLAPHTYEFTVHFMNGRQLATNKLQLKVDGKKLVLTGLDPIMKKQPINGKTFEANSEITETE